MARKRAQNPNHFGISTSSTTAGGDSALPSPTSSGAMDSLLERLRAAGREPSNQRDRRRRARLKSKHEVRIASGQKVPDNLFSPGLSSGYAVGDSGDEASPSATSEAGGRLLSPPPPMSPGEKEPVSEGEDIADRAASLLQGLRGDGVGDGAAEGGAGSARVRRRRENADEERKERRRRRAGQGSVDVRGDEAVPGTELPVIKEPSENGGEEEGVATGRSQAESAGSAMAPIAIVSPPTPERGSAARPMEIDD